MTSLNDLEAQVRELRRRVGPGAAYRQLIAENDALIRSADLDCGGRLAMARSAIHTVLAAEWVTERQRAFGYARPFAVVALGGTGRGEVAPASDIDIAFLLDDAIEGNTFLEALHGSILDERGFLAENGFRFGPLSFNLDDMATLEGKQLNSFLDMRPLYDPAGLAGVFRDRIRATFDPFEQFMHVRGFWERQWGGAAARWEQIDRFDIKNDGLRVFLAGVWTLGSKHFLHSHEVYANLGDPRDLEAYRFLLRIRAFLHLRNRGRRTRVLGADHAEDIVEFEDLTSFGELLGLDADAEARFEFENEVRRRLLAARRRVGCFSRGVIGRELKEGRPISASRPIVCGAAGLSHRPLDAGCSPAEKSSAALSLVLASQHYSVPIDPAELLTTFRNAGDWLVPVPELAALFREERGSLADSFQFLSNVEGAEERLFPGYAKFESSLDERVMQEKTRLRSELERDKMRALERFVRDGHARLERQVRAQPASAQDVDVEVEAAALDEAHLAGVKLALKTKRLPLTADDREARQDESRAWHERFSSGISEVPIERYYEPYARCGFSQEILDIARFLVANRRAFRQYADNPNDEGQVRAFVKLCGNEQRLRALYVFTRADRDRWKSIATEPGRWFLINELFDKAMATFRRPQDPARALAAAGFTAEQVRILQDLGADFHEGRYRRHASRFGEHLVRLVEDAETGPSVKLFQDGFSLIIGVAARDYRGLAATITGTLWQAGINLSQAHLFSAWYYGLALDFFHVAGNKPLPAHLAQTITEAIRDRRYISDAEAARLLPPLQGDISLREWRPGQFCLRFETPHDSGGLVYALAYRVFRHLSGSIFSLSAHATRGTAFVSVYFSTPPGMSFAEAKRIVSERVAS